MSAFFVSAALIFFAELGDKTMLATVSLAGREASAVGVWLGSTVGMVLADAVAIGAGVLAGKRLPQRAIAVVAALLFAAFGGWALWSAWG